MVQIEGTPYLALIDSEAQLSALPESLVEKLKLKVHELNTIIEVKATGGPWYRTQGMWRLGYQFLV